MLRAGAAAGTGAPGGSEAADLRRRVQQLEANLGHVGREKMALEAQVAAAAVVPPQARYDMASLQRTVQELQTQLRFKEAEVCCFLHSTDR